MAFKEHLTCLCTRLCIAWSCLSDMMIHYDDLLLLCIHHDSLVWLFILVLYYWSKSTMILYESSYYDYALWFSITIIHYDCPSLIYGCPSDNMTTRKKELIDAFRSLPTAISKRCKRSHSLFNLLLFWNTRLYNIPILYYNYPHALRIPLEGANCSHE
jgi:hypothetical protein